MIDPARDGIEYINIYSKGDTELGRWLSNFTQQRIVIAGVAFASIEGYWYTLKTSPNNPRIGELRNVYRFQAKKLGKELQSNVLLNAPETPEFQDKIKEAMSLKLEANPRMKKLFAESELPFSHHYVYYGNVKEIPQYQWIVDEWERLRKELKESQ